jgi:hypothetical protein
MYTNIVRILKEETRFKYRQEVTLVNDFISQLPKSPFFNTGKVRIAREFDYYRGQVDAPADFPAMFPDAATTDIGQNISIVHWFYSFYE